ncbi:single-stranded-DNA-specific exonuclease RecJ [Paraneptunicella aestuarii]|uniref:single-stranded-DNA-specific exonuclease RecJ n=1 Tax=Paraneptunicella aestuarii TaxID=2831148 RepID=UPI001E59C5DC|nr:single-stranded-DNA-specific exonuclease RecJ [Paraneptunicella aestuarii]UAA39593.1 single-stranded-DNA-specific exonuclease RecJ [Paraneptunicella aestuarii]
MNIQQRPSVTTDGLSSDLHPVIQQIYARRGALTDADVQRTTSHLQHYQGLKGISEAVAILASAMAEQKHIMVVGDFDADGATSTALVIRALNQLGNKKHSYLVPNRFEFGYGLSPEIVTMAYEQGAELIITVDNGISCIEGVALAKQKGMSVVITDHHLPAEQLPNADAIVNPNQSGCEFASKNLAGVGVAFYLMMALLRHLQQSNWFAERQISPPNLTNLLDLVALGTVADVVKLDGNNRILVHQGIQRIRAGQCCAGINAMLQVAKRTNSDIDASTMGFVLGPRLNAAGRLDDMSLGIQCLLTDDEYTAIHLASRLDSLNSERREIESSMQKDADAFLAQFALGNDTMPSGIVLYEETWHQGIIGILAGRVKDKYNRPTVAMAWQDETTLKGSARSIPGVHIRDLLDELYNRYPGIIQKFGGHAAAAGLTINADKLAAFIKVFDQLCEEFLEGMELQDVILSDGQLQKECFNLPFAQQLKAAGPWGQGFPEPVFDGEFHIVQQRLVGAKHLKLVLRSEQGEVVDGIMFNVDLDVWPNEAQKAQVAYKLDINRFRNNVSLQLMIEAIEPV